jgi:hypothetical protein
LQAGVERSTYDIENISTTLESVSIEAEIKYIIEDLAGPDARKRACVEFRAYEGSHPSY